MDASPFVITFINKGRIVQEQFELTRRVLAVPHVGDTVFLQLTIAGDAPVDLIEWRVVRIEHVVTDSEDRDIIAPPHTIRVFVE
jgi:acyl dehydratase